MTLLESPSNLIPTPELPDALRRMYAAKGDKSWSITTQMLGKYRARGIIHADPTRGKGGAYMWDAASVFRELEKNRKRASRHGGQGRKQGRKKTPPEGKAERKRSRGLAGQFDLANQFAEIKAREHAPPDGVTVMDLLKYGPSELEAVVKSSEAVGLTIAHLDIIRAWLTVQRQAMELEVERRTLVKADEVKAAQTRLLEAVKQRVMEIPAKVAAEAGGPLKLDESGRAVMREVCERVVQVQMGLLAG